MNIAGFPFFFGYFFSLFFVLHGLFFSFLCIIFRMLSLTCGLVALSLFANLMGEVILLFSVTAGTSHHQCLTLLWPWSSVSSHTLNAGCLAPIGGSQMLLACFACLVLGACPVFVWCWSSEAPLYLNVIVIGLPQQRLHTLWSVCDYLVCATIPQSLCSAFVLPLWLKPYWFSAHCLFQS